MRWDYLRIANHNTQRLISLLLLFLFCGFINAQTYSRVNEPPRAGMSLPGLTPNELAYFEAGKDIFEEQNSVSGTQPGAPSAGLGPGFNMNSCGGCHAAPATGGTSPNINPQIAVASAYGATNQVPDFIQEDGPVREARFIRTPNGSLDGSVHNLFVITGRIDASGCTITQPDFISAAAANNLSFRIPTPLFGAGLIETIQDATIIANKDSNIIAKNALEFSAMKTGNIRVE